MRKPNLLALSLIGSCSVVIGGLSTSVQAAEECVALKEVTTGSTEITKQIKLDLFGNNNWNTDFAVPPGQDFQFFKVEFTPQNNASYTVKVNFKYSNNSSSTVLDRQGFVDRGETYTRPFVSPTGEEPYQVNTNIGGDRNNAYTVSVAGCYYR